MWVVEAQLRDEYWRKASVDTRNLFASWTVATLDAKFDTLEAAIRYFVNKSWNERFQFRIHNRLTDEVIPEELFG